MSKDKKIKVGYFMDDFYPRINGVNVVMDYCARLLRHKNIEVVIVVPKIDKNYVDNFPYKVIRIKGTKVKIFGDYTWALPTFDMQAKRKLYDEHFDLIHLHSPFIMGRFAVHFARKNKIPVVGTIHTRFNYELERIHLHGICEQIPMQWVATTFNRCDECFTVNQAMIDIFRKHGVTNKIYIVPNATDFTISDTISEDKEFINEKYNLKKTDNVLLFVGRINVVKNISFLLESLKILRDKGTNFKMLFVGPYEDKKVFLKKINELRLGNQIQICGQITDRNLLKKIYARADLLLLPSYFDTSSLVQVEAASQFTPTVFIENTPTASNIKDSYNGFISASDADSYADKISEVLNNQSLLNEVSKNCHNSLYITWAEVCKILSEKYRKLL